MQRRKLGASGPEVGAIGLGCMGMSDFYGPADRAESIATIHWALDSGATLIDTGDFYGSGHNELLIAEALRGRPRASYVLSFKFGALRDPAGGFIGYDARPEAVKNFLAYSLKRLGVDYIDIFRPARLDPSVPIEDTVGGDRGNGQQGLRARDRAFGSQRDHYPARRRGPSDLRPANRIFAHRADDRGRDSAGLPRARDRDHRLWRFGAGLDFRSLVEGARGGRFSLVLVAFFGRQSRAQSRAGRGAAQGRRDARRERRRGGRSVGHGAGRRHCAAGRRAQWDESIAADGLRLTAADLTAIEQAIPEGAAKGERYPAQAMAHLDSEKRG
jgi:Aldo/keto reductase family